MQGFFRPGTCKVTVDVSTKTIFVGGLQNHAFVPCAEQIMSNLFDSLEVNFVWVV